MSGCLENRFRSPFGTNTKLLRGVIGSISAPNDYLNTVFDDVVSQLPGSCENNALSRSPGEKLQLVAVLSVRKKSLVLSTRKEYNHAICRSSRQIETLFTWIVRRALNAISDRHITET